MPSKRDTGPIAIQPVLERLREHILAMRQGDDAHAVHQARVATRRLDVWLRLGRLRVIRDDLRWLRAVAGAVRDLDVLLGTEPPAAFAAWLEGMRGVARERLRRALDDPRTAGLDAALSVLPPLGRRRAEKGVARLVQKALREGRAFATRGTVLDLHRLRRALRRARYAVEWTGGDARRLQVAQDALGLTNDAVVALRLLLAWEGSESLAAYRAELERRVEEGREQALAQWPGLSEHLVLG